MAELKIIDLCKTYENSVEAVKSFNITVSDEEFIVIVGPSGCGKSTILRMIAGLEQPSSGTVLLDGSSIDDFSPQKRDIAMIFQNYALYENMTVYDNIAFPLKVRGKSREEIFTKVNEVADLLKITYLLKRKPRSLSGGEKQRVAMGRAIIRKPKLFLMDEPLSNLDAKLRLELRNEISQLLKRIKVTTIYVTHDQGEAMAMADRVIVMNKGKVEQIGTPKEVYDNPATPFAALFFGNMPMNLWQAQDGKTIYGIRPEDILISRTHKPNWIRAIFQTCYYNGVQWIGEAICDERKFTICSSEPVEQNQEIYMLLPKNKVHCWSE